MRTKLGEVVKAFLRVKRCESVTPIQKTYVKKFMYQLYMQMRKDIKIQLSGMIVLQTGKTANVSFWELAMQMPLNYLF